MEEECCLSRSVGLTSRKEGEESLFTTVIGEGERMKRVRLLLCGILVMGVTQMAVSDHSTRHSLRIIVRRTNKVYFEEKDDAVKAKV